MTENPALYAAIVAHPTEDTPRLAYADWLDENGDPNRARFIRLQYEIEKLPPIGPKASKAKKEEEALLKKHEKKWAGEIAGLVDMVRFRRGFVEWVRVTPEQFLANAKRLFELAPIRAVLFRDLGAHMPALLVDSPLANRLEELVFAFSGKFNDHGDSFAQTIAAASRLKRLRTLDLSDNNITDAGARALTQAARLAGLQRLTLRGHRQTLGKVGRELLQKRFGKDVCVF